MDKGVTNGQSGVTNGQQTMTNGQKTKWCARQTRTSFICPSQIREGHKNTGSVKTFTPNNDELYPC